jgi:hypothetical protein
VGTFAVIYFELVGYQPISNDVSWSDWHLFRAVSTGARCQPFELTQASLQAL